MDSPADAEVPQDSEAFMFDLSEKRALVCGASQGIGAACAQALTRAGASVTLLARSEVALKTALGTLSNVRGAQHDYIIADADQPERMIEQVQSHLRRTGPYHILVNNSGGPPSGPITDASPEEFRKALTRHVLGNQLLAQALTPGMKEAGYGRIINIISTSVLVPIAGLGVSNTTRGAVANWARTWAAELAPFGITVNNVLPGYTDTERLQSLFDKKSARTGIPADKVRADTIDAIPMKRLADPQEIGGVVAFLASAAASYVTGVNLPVDGGRTAIQ